jgi:peptide deformylase
MTGLELVSKTDPILRQEPEQFDFENPQMDPEELSALLQTKMIQENGVGLSAVQVGINLSVFCVGHRSQPDEIMTVFNPKIVDYSVDMEEADEGCLSFPGYFMPVLRSKEIRVRFSRSDGTTDTIKLDGFAARVFQHEYDHCIGKTFQHRVSRMVWERAGKKAKILLRKVKRGEVSV